MKLSLFLGKFFLFFLPFMAYAWNVDPVKLREKLEGELPLWASEQLQGDFSFFEKTISSRDITKYLNAIKNIPGADNCGLVRVKVTSNTLYSKPVFTLDEEQSENLKKFTAVLHLLSTITSLPDLDFVFCTAPSFDRPILLKETNIPILAVSKERANKKVVLIPRLWNSDREICFKNLHYPWNQKLEKAFWRGAPSDGPYGPWDWEFRYRALLTFLHRNDDDLVDAKLVPTNRSNQFPRHWLESLKLLGDHVNPEEQIVYKYLLSFDGRASPSSFEWQLFSGSLVFKSESNRIEWFYKGLQEGVHFVAIAPNGSDLRDNLYYAMTHDDESLSMAQSAQQFAYANLIDEDLFTYLYHVLCCHQKLKK